MTAGWVGPAAAGISEEARAAKAQGDRHAAAGDLEAAIESYGRALEIQPGYALARNELGTALFRQGRLPEAIAQFEHAVRIDQDYATAWFNLAFASRRAERFETAARAYERHTELRPDEPDAWYGLGESLAALERFAEAAEAFETYAERESRPARRDRAQGARGRAEELRAKEREARSARREQRPEPGALEDRRVDAGAEEPAPLDARVPAEPRTRREPHATREPAPPSEERPVDVGPVIATGDGRLETGDAARAAEAFGEALELAPDDVEATYKLAYAHARMGRHEEAIAGWERVLELEPDNHGARRNIELTRTRMREEAAPEEIRAAPGGEPGRTVDRPAARRAYQRGVRLVGERSFQEAADAFAEALRNDPELVQARVAMGSAYVGLERYDDARREYEAAHRARPDMAAPLFGLAETHRALGENDRARDFYQRYVDSDAADVDAGLKEHARRWLGRL